MKNSIHFFLLAFLVAACNQSQKKAPNMEIVRKPYPITEEVDQKDKYFDTVVEDPYRWLEDDRSEKRKAWITAQNSVTSAYLDQIPYRDAMRERLKSIWNYEKLSAPFKEGEYTYFLKIDGLQNQWVINRKKR
ncbi:hypothetical protein [Spirosoma fluviale]|uniref:hypothetical protein n=1 Tax=Spirosoma fluviale TaxID=1597977 RepID=UPI0026BE6D4A|nr:hypothetical protein [Spirosoma fluviale]